MNDTSDDTSDDSPDDSPDYSPDVEENLIKLIDTIVSDNESYDRVGCLPDVADIIDVCGRRYVVTSKVLTESATNADSFPGSLELQLYAQRTASEE